MKHIFISEVNFNIVNQIQELEQSAANQQRVYDIFNNAVLTVKSARAWVECGHQLSQSGKHTHAGIAFLIAAGISESKGLHWHINSNMNLARTSFFNANDAERGEACLTRARLLTGARFVS
jgi:hypothetical protein